jgi:hypothetical protein
VLQDLKLSWLREGLLHLQTEEPTIADHIPLVVQSVQKSLQVPSLVLVRFLRLSLTLLLSARLLTCRGHRGRTRATATRWRSRRSRR